MQDSEPFRPSPALLPAWDEASARLVLSAESDGSVRVWHLPSLIRHAEREAAAAHTPPPARSLKRASHSRKFDVSAGTPGSFAVTFAAGGGATATPARGGSAAVDVWRVYV